MRVPVRRVATTSLVAVAVVGAAVPLAASATPTSDVRPSIAGVQPSSCQAVRFTHTQARHVLHVAENVYITAFGAETYASFAPDLQRDIEQNAQRRLHDAVLWDNTGVLHRALPYDLSSDRMLRRTHIKGQEAWA